MEGCKAERRWDKEGKDLVTAAEHSIGNTEAPRSARKEIRNLLNDYEIYKSRMDELMGRDRGITF